MKSFDLYLETYFQGAYSHYQATKNGVIWESRVGRVGKLQLVTQLGAHLLQSWTTAPPSGSLRN